MYVSATSTRFSRGMSMPAMRAIRSALPLLVLGVRADDHHGPVPADHFAVVTARLDRRSDLHGRSTLPLSLPDAVRDSAARQVIRRKLDPNTVTGQDPDEVHPQLAADMGENAMAVFELDREHRVRQRLDDGSFDFDRVLFRHSVPYSRTSADPSRADTRKGRISTGAIGVQCQRWVIRSSSGSRAHRPL